MFPDEFPSFLGLTGPLQEAFSEDHGDLFDASWWKETQRLVASGEIASVYPYRRELRLHPDGK